MNRDELINEINKTKEHLANMEKMLKGCEYERWEPKEGESYYFVGPDSKVYTDINHKNIRNIGAIRAYNCFKTKGEAEQECEKILVRRQLEDIARRLNKGKQVMWYTDGAKYYLYINCDGEIDTDYNAYLAVQGTIYCLDKSFKRVAIEEIGQERLSKYLKGE